MTEPQYWPNEKECGLSNAGIRHKPHAWIVQRIGFGCPGIDPDKRRTVYVVTFEPHGDDQGGVGGVEWNYHEDAMVTFYENLIRDLDKLEGETLVSIYTTTVPMLNRDDVTDYLNDGFLSNDPPVEPTRTYVTGRTGVTYEQQQIDRVLDEAHAIDQMHTLQIQSGSTSTATKWLNVTTEQVQRIRAVFADDTQ